MKKTLILFLLMLWGCVRHIPFDERGNITGRIDYKKYEFGRPYFSLTDGTGEDTCSVSFDEFVKFNVGDIYTCKYK